MNKLKVGDAFHQTIIENESNINLFDISRKKKLNYLIKENASLTLNIFSMKSLDLTIDIILFENAKLDINVSFINNDNYNLTANINLNGNNIKSNLHVRGINKKGKVNIVLNGIDLPNLDGNIVNEYAKVINYSEDENILIPNLLVNSYGILANHGVSIGSFDEELLFYLECKGIKKSDAKKLLEEGFILYNLPDNEKDEVKKILGVESSGL